MTLVSFAFPAAELSHMDRNNRNVTLNCAKSKVPGHPGLVL